MSASVILHTFKEKIEDAAALVHNMDAEEKLQAVEHWNVVSEQLQIIVNHSAEDIGAFAFQMDEVCGKDFIDASQLVALGLAPAFMPSFVTNNSLDVTSDILRKTHPQKDVEGTVVITTAFTEDVVLPSLDSDPSVIIKPDHSTDTTELGSCNHLQTDGLLDTTGTSTSQITMSVVGDELDDAVGLEDDVRSEELDMPDSIVEADEAVMSEVLNNTSPVPTLPPVDTTHKPSASAAHRPPKTKGKSKSGEGNDPNMENLYECTYCRRIFFTPSQLTAHVWTHTKPYSCGVCNARFSTKGNLVVHNRRHSGERPFVCPLCQASFSTKGNLLRHRKGHLGEKPWQCHVCNSRFTEKKSLKVHMRRHTGERPYHCTMCPKSFTQAGILQTHIATHLDQRDYPCSLCGKSFRQKSQLRLHEQRHAGLRKYQCSICPSKFLTKGDMERHKRVHTGERPFTCKLCQKSFTRQQSLNEHMNRHYGLKPYQCKYCNKGYVEMSACYKHVKTHERGANAISLDKDSPDSPVANAQDEDIAAIFEDSSESIHRSEESSTFFMEELI